MESEDFGYTTKWSLNETELEQIYRLRGKVFCRELAWVRARPDGREIDEFDGDCTHFGIFNPNGLLVATARVSAHAQPWMLDRHFRSLIPDHLALRRGPHTCEFSRLAIEPYMRSHRVGRRLLIADLVYKGLFNFCLLRDIRYGYAVVSHGMLRHMSMHGLAFKLVGPLRYMPDGVHAGVIKIDWDLFIIKNRKDNLELLRWYMAWGPGDSQYRQHDAYIPQPSTAEVL